MYFFVFLPVFKRRFNLSERVKESDSQDHFHRPKSHVYGDYKRRNAALWIVSKKSNGC